MMIFPAETVMPFIGYQAAQGTFSLPFAILVGTLGSSSMSIVIYLVARGFGQSEHKRFPTRYAKLLGLTPQRIARAGAMFDRHAKATVFLGRFLPGVRSAVSLPAGYRGMPFTTFALLTAAGSGLNTIGLGLIGYSVRSNLQSIQTIATNVSYAIAAGIVIALVAIYFVRRWRSNAR